MSIKPTQLIIKTIGKIADSVIDINKPLILFYGEIRQGKSTILNCVRWVCGGEFPADLIDRAESLGKSIFEFVDRAKAEKKTIMATIVGERPAKVPPEIGVFVVEDGKVKE